MDADRLAEMKAALHKIEMTWHCGHMGCDNGDCRDCRLTRLIADRRAAISQLETQLTAATPMSLDTARTEEG